MLSHEGLDVPMTLHLRGNLREFSLTGNEVDAQKTQSSLFYGGKCYSGGGSKRSRAWANYDEGGGPYISDSGPSNKASAVVDLTRGNTGPRAPITRAVTNPKHNQNSPKLHHLGLVAEEEGDTADSIPDDNPQQSHGWKRCVRGKKISRPTSAPIGPQKCQAPASPENHGDILVKRYASICKIWIFFL